MIGKYVRSRVRSPRDQISYCRHSRRFEARRDVGEGKLEQGLAGAKER